MGIVVTGRAHSLRQLERLWRVEPQYLVRRYFSSTSTNRGFSCSVRFLRSHFFAGTMLLAAPAARAASDGEVVTRLNAHPLRAAVWRRRLIATLQGFYRANRPSPGLVAGRRVERRGRCCPGLAAGRAGDWPVAAALRRRDARSAVRPPIWLPSLSVDDIASAWRQP